MHIVVTGGSGVIGRYVVDALLGAGHDVTVFDLADPDVEGAAFVEGDVTDGAAVREGLADADHVIHMAALLPADCEADPARAERVNVGGTINVLEAATALDVPVIAISSKAAIGAVTGVHGHPTYEPLSESVARDPTNVYGATKLAVEHYCAAYRRNEDLQVAAVRFGHTYGPGKVDAQGAMGMGLVSKLIERAARGETVRLSGGDQKHDFIYAVDIGRAFAAMVETDLAYGVYHVASGTARSLFDFQAALETTCPDATIEIEGGLDPLGTPQPGYCRLDISRAREDFGFEPAYPIPEAVEDFVARL